MFMMSPHMTSAMSNDFTFLSQPLQPRLPCQTTLYDHTSPVSVGDAVVMMVCRKCERCESNWFGWFSFWLSAVQSYPRKRKPIQSIARW